ncbi:MAG: AAA family ATPase, partial [Treponema sp.]|nr:AAA family ATPase [Candidatus Treponema scatequi]
MYLERHIFSYIERMLKQFKVILITGSRQVGKSTMLKEKLLSQYEYTVLDDFSELDLARRDPVLFFKNHKIPLIVDEVQRAPELFLQIKYIADLSSKKGRIVLTGSQSHKLIKEVSDSLAGRLCFIDMSSLSMREIMKIDFNKEFLPVDEYLNARQKKIKQYE